MAGCRSRPPGTRGLPGSTILAMIHNDGNRQKLQSVTTSGGSAGRNRGAKISKVATLRPGSGRQTRSGKGFRGPPPATIIESRESLIPSRNTVDLPVGFAEQLPQGGDCEADSNTGGRGGHPGLTCCSRPILRINLSAYELRLPSGEQSLSV